MEAAPTGKFSISHARLTAYGAVLLLCGFVGWGATHEPVMVASNTSTEFADGSANSDYLSQLSAAVDAQLPEGFTPLGASIVAESLLAYEEGARGASSSAAGIEAVKAYGENVKPELQYRTYAASDVKTAPDTSKDRVLAYRADLRVSLEPLLENKENELDIFASYVESRDPKYTAALQMAAANYRQAIANTELVTAPADAAIYHAAILTAMTKFATMLDVLVQHADDPFASAALMRTYLDAQDTMLASFSSIGKYSAQKTL